MPFTDDQLRPFFLSGCLVVCVVVAVLVGIGFLLGKFVF